MASEQRRYFIMKSEPDEYGWDDLVEQRRGVWDGVRNPQACNNIRSMRPNDLAFFYHTGKQRACVGVMRIASEPRRDPTQPLGETRWLVVDVEPLLPLRKTVSLATIKADGELGALALVRQSRLSVIPATKQQFCRILAHAATKMQL